MKYLLFSVFALFSFVSTAQNDVSGRYITLLFETNDYKLEDRAFIKKQGLKEMIALRPLPLGNAFDTIHHQTFDTLGRCSHTCYSVASDRTIHQHTYFKDQCLETITRVIDNGNTQFVTKLRYIDTLLIEEVDLPITGTDTSRTTYQYEGHLLMKKQKFFNSALENEEIRHYNKDGLLTYTHAKRGSPNAVGSSNVVDTFAYDADNRLIWEQRIHLTRSGPTPYSTEQHSYTEKGLRDSSICVYHDDSTGSKTSYVYDNKQRLVQQKNVELSGGELIDQMDYTYTTGTTPTTIKHTDYYWIYEDTITTIYTFDANHHLVSVESFYNPSSQPFYRNTFVYDKGLLMTSREESFFTDGNHFRDEKIEFRYFYYDK